MKLCKPIKNNANLMTFIATLTILLNSRFAYP